MNAGESRECLSPKTRVSESDDYVNIRELIGHYIGRTIVDITQHDAEEFEEDDSCYVLLMFDDGSSLQFDITDAGGFHYQSVADPSDP